MDTSPPKTYSFIPINFDLDSVFNEPLPSPEPQLDNSINDTDDGNVDLSVLEELPENLDIDSAISKEGNKKVDSFEQEQHNELNLNVENRLPEIIITPPSVKDTAKEVTKNEQNKIVSEGNTIDQKGKIHEQQEIVVKNLTSIAVGKISQSYVDEDIKCHESDVISPKNAPQHKIEKIPLITPAKSVRTFSDSNNEKEVKQILEKIEENVDLGIGALPLKTPIKSFKPGKENFLNSQQKPRHHLIKTPLLKTPSYNSSSKLYTPISFDKKNQNNFRTPVQPTITGTTSLLKIVPHQSTTVSSKVPEKFAKLRVNLTEFVVLRVLGKGGSSVVYQCFDCCAKENRAIKCVSLDSPTSSEGFIKEIEVLRRLQYCDRIIRMYDYELSKQDKMLHVVLEMGGCDLSQILRDLSKHEQVTPSYLILFYWMEMLNAVQQIHQHGIIHSDLKPANFLQVGGRLKIIDFGISSCVQNDKTSVIKTISEGSSNYISPEALNSEYSSNRHSPNYGKPKYKISFKADVWSLGCILYQLIYKKTPFQYVTNQMQKLMIIANPSTKIEFPEDNGVPIRFLRTAQRCLVFDSKIRPNVNDLITEYEQFC